MNGHERLTAGQQLPAARPEACYGVTCPLRGKCGLYVALGLVDGWVILHCRRGDEWPLFTPKGTA